MLSDLLVLDLTQLLPGPYATQLLADYGAQVVKIEPLTGDPVRHLPPHDARGLSAAFQALNTGKRSLALDLKHPRGIDLLLRLVEKADVLMEGFRPGTLKRLGAGPEACQARNPRLIYCSLSGYGQDGPYRERAGHDMDYLAYSGALSISTSKQGVPTLPGIQVADGLGAFSAVTGILLALHERQRTGKGRWIDACMLDSVVSLQGLHFGYHRAGTPAEARAMPLNGGWPCYDLYSTSEGGSVALGALEPKFWQRFCAKVERSEWIGRQFDPSLRDEVAQLFLTRTREAWCELLEDAECCLAPILDYDEVQQNPQIQARELFSPTRVAPPIRFRPAAPPHEQPSPALRPGEHSRQLLRELLDWGLPELEALIQEGVVRAEDPGPE